MEEFLNKRQRQLKTFLSQVVKCVSENHYTPILSHATSLELIFNTIKRDNDIKTSRINFLSLSKIMYDTNTMTPVGFYQRYQAHILQNTAKIGTEFPRMVIDSLQQVRLLDQ